MALEFNRRYNKNNSLTVSEIVSEASVTAIRCIDLYDYRRGFQFSTYFYNSFLRNAIRILLRDGMCKGKSRKHKTILIGDADQDIRQGEADSGQSVEDVAGISINQLFSVLNSQQRSVLNQRFLEGKTLKEIGDAAGLSKERIRQVETQALKAIRKSLGLDLPGGDR